MAWGDYDEIVEDQGLDPDMLPFTPGSWYECDGMAHVHGVSRAAGTIQIEDENGNTVFEKSLDDCDGCNDSPGWSCNDEVWVGMAKKGEVVFIGSSNEKGTFFEGEIKLEQPFDVAKLELGYDEIDGNDIINRVQYDGEQIENWGADTSGKSSEFGFYLVKDSNTWEKYCTMDDIKYPMTEWFPKKIMPVREGVYMIRTAGKNSYTYQAKWTGTKWVNSYTDEENYDNPAYEVKIKEWQGISFDPEELEIREDFDKLVVEFDELSKEEN
jgi:hypothetical protein